MQYYRLLDFIIRFERAIRGGRKRCSAFCRISHSGVSPCPFFAHDINGKRETGNPKAAAIGKLSLLRSPQQMQFR
jgi:hypothetical protein